MKRFKCITLLLLSLVLFNLPSIAQNYIIIGTGTASTPGTSASPVNNWWRNYRMQIMYDASEFTAQGIVGAQWIHSIGFNVTGLPNTGLPGYTIRVATVPSTTTSLTGTLPSASFTTVYQNTGTQTFTTGWNQYNFTAPFYWNGTDNIVVEVCWGIISTTYSMTGTVQYTNVSGHMRYFNSDWTSACPSNLTQSSTYRANARFDVSPFLLPCTGQPNAGLMSSYPPTPCVNNPFTLTLTGLTQATNLVFDWQEALPATPNNFSTIVGSSTTQNFYSSSFQTPKWYRVIVTCPTNNLSDTSAPLFVDSGGFFACYCNPGFSQPNGVGYFIDSIGIAGTTLANGSTGKGPGGHQIFPHLGNTTATLSQGATYTITMVRGNQSSFTHKAGFWIDYDQSGTYEPTEYTQIASPYIGYVYSANFTTPTNVPAGPTGMRVIFTNSNFSGDACLTNYGDGEVEDYVIDMDYPPCTNPANAGTAFPEDTAVCSGANFLLVDTGHVINHLGLTFLWQRSSDGINFYNISGSNTDSLQTSINTPTYFRFVVICDGIPNYSNTFYVNLLPQYACYCPNKSTAFGEKSDIGAFKFGSFLLYAPGGSHLLNPNSVRQYTSHQTKGPIEAYIDTSYNMAVYHVTQDSVHSNAKVSVFIDYDRNGLYESGKGEKIYTGISQEMWYYLNDAITIPSTASTGLTGLRVVLNEDLGNNAASDDGCGYYASGETEDYLLEIKQAFPTSVYDLDGLSGFSIYPNPATQDQLNYYIKTSKNGKYILTLQSVNGQNLQTKEIQVYNDELGQLDISEFSAGLYILKLTNSDGQSTSQKFSILR